MAPEISEISAVIVDHAVRNNELDPTKALSEGSLAKLHLCAEAFIGRDAVQLLWERAGESTAIRVRSGEGKHCALVQLNDGNNTGVHGVINVPIRLFVETYISQLADLIGLELCLRHLKACYSDAEYEDG
jgi:hypothetical protein